MRRGTLNRNGTAFTIMSIYDVCVCVFFVDKKPPVVGNWFFQCGSTNE